MEYPKSKISIRLPRSVFGGYHFWFGCCLVDLNLTEITMETSGSLFPFLIWQRHYVFKNTRGCLLASEYSKTISLIQCSKYKQSLQNYQRSSFGQIWFWKTLKFWFWSTLKWQKLEIYYFFNFKTVKSLILVDFWSAKIWFLTNFVMSNGSKFDFWPILIGQNLIFDQFW